MELLANNDINLEQYVYRALPTEHVSYSPVTGSAVMNANPSAMGRMIDDLGDFPQLQHFDHQNSIEGVVSMRGIPSFNFGPIETARIYTLGGQRPLFRAKVSDILAQGGKIQLDGLSHTPGGAEGIQVYGVSQLRVEFVP